MAPLITGGAGFIGSHVAQWHYESGLPVTVLDDLSSGKRSNVKENATLVEGDVADATLVDRLVAECDGVYHLAAIAAVQVCEQEPERAHRTNVIGADTVFNAALRHGKPVVYASSAAVYGDNFHLPLAEDAALNPLGNYGKHKRANEQSAARLAEQGLKSVGLRFFNIYGARQDPKSPYSGVISIFHDRLRAGEPVTMFGDGNQSRDFVYVGDVVTMLNEGLALAREGFRTPNYKSTGADIFNVCTGTATSLHQLAWVLSNILRVDLDVRHEPARANDIRHSLGDPTRIMQAVHTMRWTPLLEGLTQTVGSHDG